ncbi:MAG TPA: PAS domain-containing protein, partial [bacterium]
GRTGHAMKSLRVLHLEDVEADALLVEHALRKGGYDPDVRVESSALGFQEALDAGSWDIILSDHGMGEFNALDALALYHAHGCEVPFILVSGQIGEEQAAEAMRRGSHDFVSKTRLARLIPVVTRALEESSQRQQIRHYQKQLEERANQLQMFVEQAPASIAMLDAELRLVAVSGRWRADFGFGEIDVKGRSVYDVFPELSQEHRQTMERCLQGNVERQDAYPFERETGEIQWLRWEIRPWHVEAGQVGGLFVFTEDVTDHVRARTTLQEREWMFTRAEGLAHVGTFYRDLRTGRLTGSDEAYRILGEGSSKILALDDRLTTMVHPDDREAYLRTRAAVREEGGRHTHTFRIIREGAGSARSAPSRSWCATPMASPRA